MLPGFFIYTHNTFDMPVVLWGINKNPSFTEKGCNRLGMHLGNKSHSWLFNCLRVTTYSVDSPLLPLAIEALSE